MASKAEKRKAGRIKQAQDIAASRASGLRAQEADKKQREDRRKQIALLALTESDPERSVLTYQDLDDIIGEASEGCGL